MSDKWIRQILNRREEISLSGDDLFCALMIASYANKDTGECFPGFATIAKDLGKSERTVQRIVGRLGHVFEQSEGRGRGRNMNFKLRLKHATGGVFSDGKTRQMELQNTTNGARTHIHNHVLTENSIPQPLADKIKADEEFRKTAELKQPPKLKAV